MIIVATTSLPAVDRWNADRSCQKREKKTDENSGHYVVCQQSTARTATPERRPLERRTLVPIHPIKIL